MQYYLTQMLCCGYKKKPIEPKNKTTNPTNPKTHQGFFYNLGLSNNGIKDTATPDTGYSFRV